MMRKKIAAEIYEDFQFKSHQRSSPRKAANLASDVCCLKKRAAVFTCCTIVVKFRQNLSPVLIGVLLIDRGKNCVETTKVIKRGIGLMIHNSIYKRYNPSIVPCGDAVLEWLFVFNSTEMLVKKEVGNPSIPNSKDFDGIELAVVSKLYLGELEGYPCYCMEVDDSFSPPEGMLFRERRSLLGQLEEDIFLLAGRAFQIVDWNRMNKFCGKCGTPTETQQKELAKRCSSCGSVFYPRISPAVIVAVVRGDEILLAHNKNFKKNWYSVIAGFVEPGETFEDCVKREVMEEVGIRVKNIKYFASQPWPFPNSLMIGFIAEYESGEINVDGEEIDDAAWYEYSNLPQRPTKSSIAGRLIEFVMCR
jgi:NAD+ diphosphatase